VATELSSAADAVLRARLQTRYLRMAGVVGWFAAVGLLVSLLPMGHTVGRSQAVHALLVGVLVSGAANYAWSTWLRFRLDGTSRAWLLAAAFAVLALVFAPSALVSSGSPLDDAFTFFGPISRLGLGLVLILAMSPTPVPRVLRQPAATLVILVAAVGGTIQLVLHPDTVLGWMGDHPAQRIRLVEAAALAALCISLVQFYVKYVRTRRPIMITWIAGVAAIAVESALMLRARPWEVRWWFAELGIAVSAGAFILGTDRKMAGVIDEKELRLVYQPKIWLRTGEIAGAEALMRWQHPDHGLVPPDSFIPTAEATDLIAPFTLWAIREAIRQHREWLDTGLVVPIAVNVTVRLLRDDRLLEMIKRELATHSLDVDAISLELTESQALETEPAARETLAALRDLGLRMAVDDFGTGYSSLTYLRNLPVQEVKLDKSFVQKMEHHEHDFLIVQSTVDLVQKLGHKVIAEGIETEEARNLLTALGCDVGQGYYWSKPLMADDFEAWARAYEPTTGGTWKSGGTWTAPADPTTT
jgi:EAL domain-containing protein (putative c-di-GMP-specific phosphodiesterase class I)